jgi:ketosteroid isomerase-like protein
MDAAALDLLATNFFGAIERGDVEAVRSMYTDDAVVWHNNDGVEQPKDRNLQTLAWMKDNLTGLQYTEQRRMHGDDGFFQQHVLIGVNRAGQPFAMPAALRAFVTEDGRIRRIEEYLDSGQIATIVA